MMISWVTVISARERGRQSPISSTDRTTPRMRSGKSSEPMSDHWPKTRTVRSGVRKARMAGAVGEVEREELDVVAGGVMPVDGLHGRGGLEVRVFLAHRLEHLVGDARRVGTRLVGADQGEGQPARRLHLDRGRLALVGLLELPVRGIREADPVAFVDSGDHRVLLRLGARRSSAASCRSIRIRVDRSIGPGGLPTRTGDRGDADRAARPTRSARLGRLPRDLVQ